MPDTFINPVLNASAPQARGAQADQYGVLGRHGGLVVLLALGTFCSLDSFLLSALITPLKSALGLTDEALGRISAATTLAGIVGAPLFAMLVVKFQRKYVLAAAVVFWSLASSGGALAAGVGGLILWRALTGFGASAYQGLAPGWLADLYDKRSRNVVFSLFMLRNKLGSALGLSIGAWLAASYGWHTAFLGTGLPGLALAAILLLLPEPVAGAGDGLAVAPPKPKVSDQVSIFRFKPYSVHLIALVFFFAGTTTAQMWFPAYLHRVYGLTNREAAGYLSLVLMSTLPVGIIGGWLTGKYLSHRKNGLATVLALTSLLAAVLFAAAFTTRDLVAAKWLAALAIASFGSTAGSLTTLAVETVPAHFRSFAGSQAFIVSNGISGIVAPWLLGALSDKFGLSHAIYLGAAAYGTAGVIWGVWVIAGLLSKNSQNPQRTV